jgi:hypothetical protein
MSGNKKGAAVKRKKNSISNCKDADEPSDTKKKHPTRKTLEKPIISKKKSKQNQSQKRHKKNNVQINSSESNNDDDDDDDDSSQDDNNDQSGSNSSDNSDSDSSGESSDDDDDDDDDGPVMLNSALWRSVEDVRSDDWMLQSCVLIRRASVLSDECKSTLEYYASVQQYLSDAIKSEILSYLLSQYHISNEMKHAAALEDLTVQTFIHLGAPIYLNRMFACRYLWTLITGGKGNETHPGLRRFIDRLSRNADVNLKYGVHHVLLRLLSRHPLMDGSSMVRIEDLNSEQLLYLIHDPEDVNDLLSLGWKPSVGTLLHYIYNEPSTSKMDLINYLSPAIWNELGSTLPVWMDSPYGFKLDPNYEQSWDSKQFWTTVPDPWLAAEKEARTQCPSLTLLRRTTKLPLMKSKTLQCILSILQKSPRMFKIFWIKNSLTWLNYIQLFSDSHLQVMWQILMHPPLERTYCSCNLTRLQHINDAIQGHKKRPRPREELATMAPLNHLCGTDSIHRLMRPQKCAPWYRVVPPPNDDGDVLDMIPAILSENILKTTYGTPNYGRTVAVAHFLILMYLKKVTTTTIMVLAEIVTGWKPNKIQTLRDILTIVSKITPIFTPQSTKSSEAAAAAVSTTNISHETKAIGQLGSSGQVQSHLLYKNPHHAPLSKCLRRLYLQLRNQKNINSTNSTSNLTMFTLASIYDTLHLHLY